MNFNQWLWAEYGLKPEAAARASFSFESLKAAYQRGYDAGVLDGTPSSDSGGYSNGPEGLDKG